MKNRSFNYSSNRFGYQGSHKDPELSDNDENYSTLYRELDADIGSWFGIDPKINSSESPYASMGNNPIWRNDFFGDKFDDKSKPKVEEHKNKLDAREKDITKSISETENLIKNSTDAGTTKVLESKLKDLNSQKKEVVNAKSELTKMETSEQLFKIGTAIGDSRTIYDKKDKAVVIEIGSNSADKFASLGHELKHGFQFLEGKTSFRVNDPTSGGQLYDLDDEVEAYHRQYALSPSTTLIQVNKNQKNNIVTDMEGIHYNVIRDMDPPGKGYNDPTFPSTQAKKYSQATDIKVSKKNLIK